MYEENWSLNENTNPDINPLYIEVRPWLRFWARLLDYVIFVSFLLFLSDKLLKMPQETRHKLVYYLISLFFWALTESLLLSLLGTTPGKWLLNIVIRDMNGKKLSFSAALKRSLLLWLKGIWMGVPLVNILGLISAYNRLLTQKNTIWDKKSGCIVSHGYGHIIKQLTLFALYTAFVIYHLEIPLNEYLKSAGAAYQQNYTSSYNYSGINGGAHQLNEQGYLLLNHGLYAEGKNVLLKGLDTSPSLIEKDSLYNNLSWACYCLEEYESALQYIEYSLDIQPNNSNEYVNYGNALNAVDRHDDAVKAYERSLVLDRNNACAYYGLGIIQFEKSMYMEAAELFEKYVKSEDKDIDGWCYLGMSYMYGDKDMVKAKHCLDKAFGIDSADASVIDCMATYYSYSNDNAKAEELYKKAISENPENYELLCNSAEYFSNSGKSEEAINYADQAISLNKSRSNAYRIKAQAYLWNDEKEQAAETIDAMILNNLSDGEVYDIAGELYYNAYEYKTAQTYYEKALEQNKMDETAIIGKIGCLYYRKRYSACLEYALNAGAKFGNRDILWFTADAYSAMGDSGKAIDYYRRAISKDPENINLLISLGWEHYNNGDFAEAKASADRALKIDSSNYGAKNLEDSAGKRQRSIVEQASEFIKTNYMYYKLNSMFDTECNKLRKLDPVSPRDIGKLFEAARQDDDMFSFVLYGDDYTAYQKMCSSETTEYKQVDKNIHYISIRGFTQNTSNEFLDTVERIENTEDSYLIIDLRGNGGGDTTSGCNILDFLLPDCVVCNLIYKDGYSSPYYSDDEYIGFRRIFVLTDENSASCSELVTLGLKTYLDNVTVIGRKTFGKGVGQIGYDDKLNKMAIFVVNHFWNVREVNIMDKGVEPDIQVEGDSLENYMDQVMNIINE